MTSFSDLKMIFLLKMILFDSGVKPPSTDRHPFEQFNVQCTQASSIKHSFYSHYFKTFTFHLKEFNRIFFNFHKLMFMCYKSYHQPEQILPTSFPMSNILVIVVIVSLIHWCVPFTIDHVVVKEILIAVDDMSVLCTHNLNHRCDDDDEY